MRVKLKHSGCPGDWITTTSAVYSIWKTYPNYRFRLEECCPDIYNNAPWHFSGKEDVTIRLDYCPERTDCDTKERSFNLSFLNDLNKKLGFNVQPQTWTPHIYLSDEEVAKPCISDSRYAVGVFGYKLDYPVKHWGFDNWQVVCDWIHTNTNIKVVQLGEINPPHHVHLPLQGCINLMGKTPTRELFRVASRACLGLSHESYLHHVMASTFHHGDKVLRQGCPHVCVASGWNPRLWNEYPTERYISRQGTMTCCQFGGCNKPKLKDCLFPDKVGSEPVAKCMALIKPTEIIDAIKEYIDGGLL